MRRLVVLVAVLAFVFVGVAGVAGMRWYRDPERPSIKTAAHELLLGVERRFTPPVSAAVLRSAHDRALRDDWTTYAHDDLRTGYESADTGITASNVDRLQRRWMRPLHEPVWASPIAAGGFVYVATDQGNVYALDAATGNVRWQRNVGNSVRMTPLLQDGMLFVGTYGALGTPNTKPHGAAFTALDPKTGAVRWQRPLPGLVRSEPVIVHGVIYEGLAGGDSFSGCFGGRVIALDEKTGAPLPMEWLTSHKPNNGGGVWAPLSTDGRTIYVGTGNTCDNLGGSENGDSIVALSPALKTVWSTSAKVPGVDDSDVGGGVALAGRYAYVAGKSGYLYQLDRKDGAIVRRTDLKPWGRNAGSIGTPTGDGSVLVISGGEKTTPDAPNMSGCVITAFNPDGTERYHFTSTYPVRGYAAFVTGVGFLLLDRSLVAFDTRTGQKLWTGDMAELSYPSPIVVPSGVYAVTNTGDVNAFGLSDEDVAHAPPAQVSAFR